MTVTLRLAKVCCALTGCLILAGCSTVSQLASSAISVGANLLGKSAPQPQPPNWKSLIVRAADDANQNSPVALDLVFVRDPALVTVLEAMPASRWFATRRDTLRTFPAGLSLISHEIVPMQSIRMQAADFSKHRALAVFVFAAYRSPGDHRERLSLSAQSYVMELAATEFKSLTTEIQSDK